MFIFKLVAKIILNGAALILIKNYFPGFTLTGGAETIIIGGIVLTAIHTFARPIIKLVTLPLLWLSFGLFNIVINIFLLRLADHFLTQISINDFYTLFWSSLIIAIANSLF